MAAERRGRYLIVEVVNLQLVASSAVGEVEAAVLLSAEQLRVLMLLRRRRKTHTEAVHN